MKRRAPSCVALLLLLIGAASADSPDSGPAGRYGARPLRAAASGDAPKSGSTFYGPQARANAAANAAKYDWARKQVEEAIAAAKPWVEISDDELWRMIVPPKLKRAIMVNVNKGCPVCGDGIYGQRGPHPYPWVAWVEGHPWKVQCPNCKELFPKNDFGTFYESGIDPQTGLFDPQRADRKLLFNADHPDANDAKHTWGVDDGNGWPRFGDALTEHDWYIGYHVYFGRSGRMASAIRSLAFAYSLTGEASYAHKCAVLLDRLADVYPDYDGKNEQFFNNVWGTYSEGILGPNYWDGAGWAQRAIDYDMIYDGLGRMPETLALVREKANRYRVPLAKNGVEDIRRNIEQRILIATGNFPDRISMNGTITEMCRAKVDLVLRGQAALDEFVGKHMPAIVPPQHLNPDGSGNEHSTGYDAGAFGEYCSLLEQLAEMDKRVAKAAIEGYPQFRAAFDFWPDIWCLEKFIPLVGDVGEPGATSGPKGSAGAYLTLFDLTGIARYAQVAMRIVGGDASKLPRNIYAVDPEGLVQRAMEADKSAGPWSTPSVVKPYYRLGILRSGKDEGRHALWLHYSSRVGTSSHAHFDALSFGLYAFGLELVSEHGYPLYTGGWPARWAWTSNTRSHATVSVDNQCQKHCPGGKLLGFARDGHLQMISAEAPCAYDNVSTYRRMMVWVEVSDGQTFIVDVFRVKGGHEHTYNVPFFYGELSSAGLAFSPHADLHDGYVTQVQAASAASAWWVDAAIRDAWKGKVAAHLRVHGPASDATVLTGRGESRWGQDDPRWLPYLFVRRENKTDELSSTFVTVYEPYKDAPFLAEHPVSAVISPDMVEVSVKLAKDQGAYHLAFADADSGAVVVRGTCTSPEGTATFELRGTPPGARID